MTDGDAHPNTTDSAIGFPALATIDVAAMVDACKRDWCDQTLCRVNDFHWMPYSASWKARQTEARSVSQRPLLSSHKRLASYSLHRRTLQTNKTEGRLDFPI